MVARQRRDRDETQTTPKIEIEKTRMPKNPKKKKKEHTKKVQRTRSARRRKDSVKKRPIEQRVVPAARKIPRAATASGVLRVQAQRLRQHRAGLHILTSATSNAGERSEK